MLSPKIKANIKKFRKSRVSDHKRIRGNLCSYGSYAIQSKARGILTSRQIEAARKSLKKHLKKRGYLWLNIFPTILKTKKPEKTRMGKGKGRSHLWCFKVHPGKTLFEFGGLNLKLAMSLSKKVTSKLPLRTCIL